MFSEVFMGCNSGIGGQAVMEGIMMRNKDKYAIAVRKPDGDIEVKVEAYKADRAEKKLLKIPVVRGVFSFIDSLVTGISCLMYSATFYEDEEEEEEPKKSGKPVKELTEAEKQAKKEKDDKIMMTTALILSIIMSVAIFVMLPYFLSSIVEKWVSSKAFVSFFEAVVRVIIFIIYLVLISRMKDIQRTFQYHGAEHKCINCVEHGKALTIENVLASSRLHKRCGTSFLFFVVIISAILFMFIHVESHLWRIVIRLLLVPVIAGISFEVIRLAGSSSNPIISALSKPGLALQKLTTGEPDASMAEVAIAAVEAVFDWKAFLNENFGTDYHDTTVSERYKEAVSELKETCGEEAQNDAWLIISKVTGLDKTSYAMNSGKALTSDQLRRIGKMVDERKSGKPVQHITGTAYFYGYEFRVTPDVLIPRYDTEVLTHEAIERLRSDPEKNTVLDLCTGSGCIGISIKKELPNVRVIASDISDKALNIARTNAANLGAAVEFIESDLFENINEKFDMIVSNPPYVKTTEKDSLDTEVKDHDPELALYAGEDGLDCYRRIAAEAKEYLKEGGILALEIGCDQAEAVSGLLKENGFDNIEVYKDLAGLDRVIIATGEKNV